MDRDRAISILQRMIRSIEAGEPPAQVREFYVFGSFARGAPSPADLDVVIIHDEPAKAIMKRIENEVKARAATHMETIYGPERRFNSLFRASLCRPGEKIDFLRGRSLKEVLEHYTVFEKTDLKLLWSIDDRDWQTKLDSIKLNPDAGRKARHELIAPKRARCSLEEVNEITKLVDEGKLNVQRRRFEDIDIELLPHYQKTLARLTEHGRLGKDVQKCLPYALWWLQENRGIDISHDGPELYDLRRRYYVRIGRLFPHQVISRFRRNWAIREQCFISHMKKDEANELIILSRGEKWAQEDYEDAEIMPGSEKPEEPEKENNDEQKHPLLLHGELVLSLARKHAGRQRTFRIEIERQIDVPFVPVPGCGFEFEYNIHRDYSDNEITTATVLEVDVKTLRWNIDGGMFDGELVSFKKTKLDAEELVGIVWSYIDAGFYVDDREIVEAIGQGEIPSYRDVERSRWYWPSRHWRR